MTKPIVFAPIPDFDQETQAVYQTEPIDKGEFIEVGIEIHDLPPQEDESIELTSLREPAGAD